MSEDAANQETLANSAPKYLWFLILSYSMVIAISNWFDSRLVLLFGLPISPGALSFPLTFLISDIITEVYGYKNARKAIWAAFLFNVLFIAYGQMIIHMPSPSFSTLNEAYSQILSLNTRIVVASFLSYLISEPINAYLVAKLKLVLKGQFMGFRFITSTLVASGIDSVFFGMIAFYGVFSHEHLFSLIINIWLVKSAVEIIGLPISTRVCKYIKNKEQMDIYDDNTRFTPFSMDTKYSRTSNKFNQSKG